MPQRPNRRDCPSSMHQGTCIPMTSLDVMQKITHDADADADADAPVLFNTHCWRRGPWQSRHSPTGHAAPACARPAPWLLRCCACTCYAHTRRRIYSKRRIFSSCTIRVLARGHSSLASIATVARQAVSTAVRGAGAAAHMPRVGAGRGGRPVS